MPFQGISIYDSNSNPILTDGNGNLFVTQAPGVTWSVDLLVNNTPLSVTLFGSPPEAALNVWVANPITVTFTETSIGVTQITSPWIVSGTVVATQGGVWTVQQGNPPWTVNAEASGVPLTATLFGSPPVEALNVYVVNPTSITFPSSLAVTQATTPWVVQDAAAEASLADIEEDTDLLASTVIVVGSPPTPALNVNVANQITVSNFPSVQQISGTVTANQGGVWTVGISPGQSVAVTQGSSPWITNIEASGVPLTATLFGSPPVEALNVYVVNSTSSSVTQGTTPWVVSGIVTANQGGAWTVTANQGGVWTVGVLGTVNVNLIGDDGTALSTSNFGVAPPAAGSPPGAQALAVNASIFQGTSAVGSTNPLFVQGTVAVSNFPAVQPVSGTVTVNQGTNPWVTNIEVGGTPLSATLFGSPPVESLNVYVVNPIAVTQSTTPWTVQGNVSVSGTVAVSNFPAIQPVSGTVSISGTVAVTESGIWSMRNQDGFGNPINSTAVGSPPVQALDTFVVNFPGSQVVTQGTNPWTVNGVVSAAQTGVWTVALTPGQTVGITGTVNVNLLTDDGTALSTSNFGVAPPVAGSPPGGQALAVNANIFQGANPIGSTNPLYVQGTIAVSNFPAVQPVSGTVTAIQGGEWDVNLEDGLGNQINSTPYGSPPVTALDVYLVNPVTQGTNPWSVNVTQFGNANVVSGTGSSGAGIPRVTVSNDSQVKIWDGTNTASVTAKGTQGVEALAVQELKDAGRTFITFVIDAAPLVVVEALQTMNINKNGISTNATSYTVSAGKTLRLQSFSIGVQATSGVQSVRGRVRMAETGGSPPIPLTAFSPFLANLVCSNPISVTLPTFTHVTGKSAKSGPGSTTLSMVLASAPAAGSVVCVGVATSVTVTALTVTDGNGNSYTVTPSSPSTTVAGAGQVWLAYLLSAPNNASATITASWTTSATAEIWADVFSINAGAALFDTDAAAFSTTAGTAINTPTITPSFSNELLFATATTAAASISAPASGATLGVWTGSGGGSQNNAMAEYDLNASSPTAVNFTSNAAGGWSSMAMAIRIAGGVSSGNNQQEFPDGIDLPSGAVIGITQISQGLSGSFICTLVGYEY